MTVVCHFMHVKLNTASSSNSSKAENWIRDPNYFAHDYRAQQMTWAAELSTDLLFHAWEKVMRFKIGVAIFTFFNQIPHCDEVSLQYWKTTHIKCMKKLMAFRLVCYILADLLIKSQTLFVKRV